ncbi:MAG TPA: protein kinase [Terriglobales bacterium]|nr:protein kinase [Terriglobales bacterium]
MEPGAPKKINKYDVLGLIGRGGMGVVYKAIDSSLDRLVAIKMVTSADDSHGDLLKRFYREAQFTANLRHQNIVTVYELGDFEGRPYLVMEYLAGQSLESMLARQPMSLRQRVSHVRQLCNGLHYAHSRQPSVIHRDIKPANIVVLEDGTAKIVDFGIARLDQSNDTRSGQIMGSYHYMSPEQIENEQLDGRTDIFSAGVVLYQLLTLTLPFEGSGIAQTLHRIVKSPPAPLNQFLKEYPAGLDDIIARALAKNRNERYQSASEFAFDLTQIEDELGRGLFDDHIQRAEEYLRGSEFDRAKQELVRVLDVDRHHARADELMKEVQQAISRQHRKIRARDFRAHAEEALEQSHFNEALSFIDQAIGLDNTDTTLQEFRGQISELQAQGKRVNELLDQAERACASHDLDEASRAVEAALNIDSNSPRARTLKAVIEAKLLEREKTRQLQEKLASARERLSAGNFSEALAFLRQAEKLDPTVSGLRGLIAVAEFGQQEQARQKVVGKATLEIHDALSRQDAPLARNLAASALEKFPEDRSLLDLKASMDRQIEAQRREQIAEIRSRTAAREFDEAERQLASARRELGDTPEFQQLANEIQSSRTAQNEEKLRRPAAGDSGASSWQFGQRSSRDLPASGGSTNLRTGRQRPEDHSVAELTPLAGIPIPDTTPRPVPPPDVQPLPTGWQQETLSAVEKQLANFIGPLARLAVRRASSRTTDLDHLYEMLSTSVASAEDRRTFLAGKIKGSAPGTGARSTGPQVPAAAANAASRAELTPAATDQATKRLARHVGPLAGVLVKRTVQRADNLRHLYELLCEHIDSQPARDHFLQEAGFGKN